jgi:pumilio family protein 6
MKGHVVKMATDPEACKVLLCVLSMVDDTVLVGKFVAAELAPAARELAFHKVGRRALLQLLRHNSKRYLPGDVLEALNPLAKVAAASKLETRAVADPKDGSDGEEDARDAFIQAAEADGGQAEGAAGGGGFFDDDDDGADGASAGARSGGEEAAAPSATLGGKKDPDLRRKELLLGKAGLGVALLDCCREHAAEMLASPVAGDVLFEALEGGGGVLEEGLGDQLAAVRARVAELTAQPRGEEGEHPCEGWFSSRLLRRVVLDGGEPTRAELWKQAFKGQCKAWLDTHAQKVLQAFVQCPDCPTRRAAVKELTPLAPVKKWQEPPPQAKGEKKTAAAPPAAAEKPAPVVRKPRSKKKGGAR